MTPAQSDIEQAIVFLQGWDYVILVETILFSILPERLLWTCLHLFESSSFRNSLVQTIEHLVYDRLTGLIYGPNVQWRMLENFLYNFCEDFPTFSKFSL